MVPDVKRAESHVKLLTEELEDREQQLLALEEEWADKQFSPEAKARSNDLNAEIEEYNARLELAKRDHRKAEIKARAVKREGIEMPQAKRPGAVLDADIYDMRSVRIDPFDPEGTGREFKDRALRAVEDTGSFVSGRISKEDAQSHMDRMLRDLDSTDGKIARHVLVTGSPAYKRAWRNVLAGGWLNPEESEALSMARAMSLTGTSGGFAVPYELDPSIIPTSNLAINPFRAISRVENITVDEWRGVASAGVTAAFAAEATSASDVSPTLAQPTVSTEKARAFVPYSIEIGQDWNGIQAELGGLIVDAKDELEASKFAVGTGTNEPAGVITGATTVYTAAATNALTSADVFGWFEALGARFRPRATVVTSLKLVNTIRKWDTTGGSLTLLANLQAQAGSVQIPAPGAMNVNLLGAPIYESTSISSAFTTGTLPAVLGDFRYYLIADRIGLTMEVIPHLFDTTANMPTGQRGLYAFWRVGAGVLSANAFRTLKFA